jgi:hypothetical protein
VTSRRGRRDKKKNPVGRGLSGYRPPARRKRRAPDADAGRGLSGYRPFTRTRRRLAGYGLRIDHVHGQAGGEYNNTSNFLGDEGRGRAAITGSWTDSWSLIAVRGFGAGVYRVAWWRVRTSRAGWRQTGRSVPRQKAGGALDYYSTRGVRTGFHLLLDGERKGFISGSAGLRDKGGAAWS